MKKLIRDILILLGCTILSVITFFAGIKIYMYAITKDNIYNYEEINKTYDYIIVPGAQINEDRPSQVLKDRLDMAIKLYENEISSKILVSGAYEKLFQKYETEIMKNYLIEKGVKKTDIIEDRGGVTTYDTMIRFYQFNSSATAIITTQKMYSTRSNYLAEKVGIKADTVISDLNYKTTNLIAHIREFLTPTKAFFYGDIMKPQPKYSLEEIPFKIEID